MSCDTVVVTNERFVILEGQHIKLILSCYVLIFVHLTRI